MICNSISYDILAKNQQLSEFLKYIRETPDLKQIYDSVKKDSTLTTNGGDNNAMDQS